MSASVTVGDRLHSPIGGCPRLEVDVSQLRALVSAGNDRIQRSGPSPGINLLLGAAVILFCHCDEYACNGVTLSLYHSLSSRARTRIQIHGIVIICIIVVCVCKCDVSFGFPFTRQRRYAVQLRTYIAQAQNASRCRDTRGYVLACMYRRVITSAERAYARARARLFPLGGRE